MCTVDIGISHDDYLMICELRHIQRLGVFGSADSHTQCSEEVGDFLVFEDAVLHGLLYVENLTAQGQDGLELAVAALLGCTAGRVTLDYKQFAIFGCTR